MLFHGSSRSFHTHDRRHAQLRCHAAHYAVRQVCLRRRRPQRVLVIEDTRIALFPADQISGHGIGRPLPQDHHVRPKITDQLPQLQKRRKPVLDLKNNGLRPFSVDHVHIQMIQQPVQTGIPKHHRRHAGIILDRGGIMADKTDLMPVFYQPLHDIHLVGMITRGYIQELHINLFSFKLYLPPFRNLCLITHHPGTQIYLCIAGDAEPIIQQFLSHFLVHSLTLRA